MKEKLKQMGYKMQQSMIGRYGIDALYKALLVIYLILVVTGSALARVSRPVYTVLWVLSLAVLIYAIFRSFSRNIAARQRENAHWLALTAPIRREGRLLRDKWTFRKTHVFKKCPALNFILQYSIFPQELPPQSTKKPQVFTCGQERDYRASTKYKITAAPKTIRYQPKALKSCFLIYPIRNLMVKMDTTKATIIPTASKMASAEVKWKPNLTSFSALAPNITGTAKKKVYSAATVRDTPMRMAPKMVAPLREVPGNTAAIN
jgi:hypothetical protein